MLSQYLPAYLHNKYLFAAIIFIVFFVISRLFVYLVAKVFMGLTSKTKTKFDDHLLQDTSGPISWLLIFIGVKIAMDYLDFQNGIAYFIETTTASLIYIGVAIVLIAVLVVFINHWGKRIAKKTKSTMDDALIPLFRRTTRVAVLIIVAIMVLDLWGVNVAGLLAGVGIAGIAIGFAVKDSLANIFGGVSLIVDKTIHVGDKIKLEDGTVGIVHDVAIRATRIKTFDNEILIVPNGKLSNMIIQNYHQPDLSARVPIIVGIEYGEDPEKAKKVALESLKGMRDIMKDPAPSAMFTEMGDFSLAIKVMFWVDSIDKVYPKKEEAMTRIYNAFNKKKIGIAFPSQTVYVKK